VAAVKVKMTLAADPAEEERYGREVFSVEFGLAHVTLNAAQQTLNMTVSTLLHADHQARTAPPTVPAGREHVAEGMVGVDPMGGKAR
jgi:hypothetical protein